MPHRWIEVDAYVFDIDGTLLNAWGGVHYNAFHAALQTFFQLDCKIDGVPLHGNTDIGILRAVLRREGRPESDLDAHLPPVLDLMCAEVERNRDLIRSEVCPAIPELITYLRKSSKLLGVASGNLEKIGWMKLEACGLHGHFSFGSFCGALEKREEIFQAAFDEVRRRRGQSATVCFVGDTPSDIQAAKFLGAPVIAVATGRHTRTELRSYAPDLCVSTCAELLELLPAR